MERGLQHQGAVYCTNNRWEKWEPKDKSRKDAIRTYWRNEERDNKKKAKNIDPSEEKPWWDEGGYDSDLGL